ncbi:methyl-accepting chemotaxis protein [Deinococcus radiophilus]|nr:methyl-accepting chemotaxis protein [Deinococcus radiophilus]UFA51887.1 hypothetical protein LMT64_12675 [Deinococcus radiophilus]
MNDLTAFTQLRQEGWIILGALMVPLTVFFVWGLLRAAQQRQAERRQMAEVSSLLNEHNPYDPEEPPDSEDLAEAVREKMEQLPAGGAVRRAMQLVDRARMMATPDLEGGVEAVQAASGAPLAAVRNVPNLLMLSGLLGTVLGLAGSIGTLAEPIRNAATATEPGALAKALAETMTLMQGAFGASLWGILLSLATGIAYALAARQQEQHQDQLAEFIHVDLVPALFPRAITGQMERMGRYLKTAGDSFENIHVKLSSVAGQLETVLGQAGETLGQSLTQLSATSTQIETVFGEMNQSVSELTEGLSRGVSDLVQAQEGAAQSLQTSSRELQDHLSQQAQIVTGLQETVGERTSLLLERVDQVGDNLGRAAKNFEQAGQSIQAENSAYASRLDRNFERLERQLSRQETPPS